MFKELKVIKLLILVSLLTGIIFKIDFADIAIQELYTDKQSYFPGDTVKIYSSSHSSLPIELNVEIFSIYGEIVSNVSLPIKKNKGNSVNILEDGLKLKNYIHFIIPKSFKSGIYLINNKHPFIIKSTRKSDITVVYPFINNIINQKVDIENAFSTNAPKTSLLRSSFVDNYSKGMAKLFKAIDSLYSVNYITDIDIENNKSIKNSKLILIYGKSSFWTPEMVNSFSEYQSNGGNLLNITTYLANNICWNNNNQELDLHDSTQSFSTWSTYDTLMPISIAGVEHNRGGYSKNKFYNILNRKHPVFKGIKDSIIAIDATLFSATPIYWYKDLPYLDFYKSQFHSGHILAYSDAHFKHKKRLIKGIFILKPTKTSGTIISLGTEEWCLNKNIGEKKQLQKITKNAIDFLLSDPL